MNILFSSSFEPVLSFHSLAAQELGTSVEQPFNCLIIQYRQAMQSMWRLMDWTFEDSVVDRLFFCVTLTGRRRAILHLCKQERKLPTPVRRRLSRTHTVLGRVFPGGWVPVTGMKVRSLVGLCNHSAFHRWSAQRAARILMLSDELMSCCTEETNGCLDLRRSAFPLDGQGSAE